MARNADQGWVWLVVSYFYEAYFAVVPQGRHRPSAKGNGKNNTVERFNLTLQQKLARLVRKTLSFSKSASARIHGKCLNISLCEYNHC